LLLTFNRQLDRVDRERLIGPAPVVQPGHLAASRAAHLTRAHLHLQLGQVTIHGARGKNAELAELPVPARYDANVPALATARDTMAYSVAHAYAHLRADLTEGTHTVPDFTHAVRHHRLLDHVQQAAITGERQHVSS
jgi:hypothetical protein